VAPWPLSAHRGKARLRLHMHRALAFRLALKGRRCGSLFASWCQVRRIVRMRHEHLCGKAGNHCADLIRTIFQCINGFALSHALASFTQSIRSRIARMISLFWLDRFAAACAAIQSFRSRGRRSCKGLRVFMWLSKYITVTLLRST
jgi:hypothetical protein